MSSDERPAKVRVYSSRGSLPLRRRDDVESDDQTRVKAVTAAPAVEKPSGIGAFGLGVFVLGCAIGGALVAWFSLFQSAAS